MMEKKITIGEDIKGLIFDIDGTIADSMPVHFLVWQMVSKRYDINFTKEIFIELAGIPAFETCVILKERFNKELNPTTYAEEKEQEYLKNMHLIRGVKPVMDVIEEYKGKLPIACGTGGDRFSASKVLDILDLGFLKDKIVCAEDVSNHKPDPETFLKAAELIGIEPKDCLVFEDGTLGMEAARSAGMQVIDVTKYYQTTIGDNTEWSLEAE